MKVITNKQPNNIIKTLKFSLKISDHDLETKLKQGTKFLDKGNKVKIIIMLKGRENSHPERAMLLSEKITKNLGSAIRVEYGPRLSGSNVTMLLGKKK